jgi:hypothetical protein
LRKKFVKLWAKKTKPRFLKPRRLAKQKLLVIAPENMFSDRITKMPLNPKREIPLSTSRHAKIINNDSAEPQFLPQPRHIVESFTCPATDHLDSNHGQPPHVSQFPSQLSYTAQETMPRRPPRKQRDPSKSRVLNQQSNKPPAE